MNDAPKYTTLRDYLRVLREQRLLIVLVVLAFTGAAILLSARQQPQYEASASIAFRAENAEFSEIGAPAPQTETPEQRAAIQAQRVTELEVAERAKEKLDSELAPGLLARLVSAQPEARTHFVVVRAESSDPAFAADLANAFAEAAAEVHTARVREGYEESARVLRRRNRTLRRRQFSQGTRAANIDRINRLQTLAQTAEPATVAVRAEQPPDPFSPKPIRNGVLGLLLGLTIGLVAAFVRDALDRRFKSVREIKEELKLPLVGHVRDDMLGRSVVSSNGKGSMSSDELEAFRILRTNVDFLDVDKPSASVVVTSALPEEGKSTVAGALAAAYASAGRRTLLVECDLRRPTLAARVGLAPAPGLSDYLVGQASPQEILQPLTIDAAAPAARPDGTAPAATLVCITAGTPSPQPAELLGSARFRAFLEQVSSVYDAVVVDSPPLLSVVDTLELIPNVDRVVICVRASRTTRDQARAAKAALEHFPQRPAGVVVTGVRPGDESDYGYYSYAYAYGPQT